MFIELINGLFDLSKVREVTLRVELKGKAGYENCEGEIILYWDKPDGVDGYVSSTSVYYKTKQACLDDYQKIKDGLILL